MIFFPLFGRVREVEISNCVHHGAFQYGRGEINPYENYIQGLANGEPIEYLRGMFIDFVRYYRPRNVGEALGVTTGKPVALWRMPWKSWLKLLKRGGWVDSPENVVDILTYFYCGGIQKSRIEEEFFWLERAWRAMRDEGYYPSAHSFITVLELRAENNSRFLVLDGNHRISALSALGHDKVLVWQNWWSIVNRAHVGFWPLVLSGHVQLRDALTIFDAYFKGNSMPFRSEEPAPFLNG